MQRPTRSGHAAATAATKSQTVRPRTAGAGGYGLLERKPIDWAAVARALRMAAANATPTQLQKALADWSRGDLIAALNEIGRAGLSKEDHLLLEWHLSSLLIVKDPAEGLSRYLSTDRTDQRWEVAHAFNEWFKKDADTALEWLRGHSEKGGWVDSKMIEQIFYPALAANPERSERILTTLPEDKRLDMMSSLRADDLDGAAQEEWVRIVRTHLPEKDRHTAISWQVTNISDGDGDTPTLEEAAAFLDRFKADAGETEACLMALADQPISWVEEGVEGIERLRQWASERAPTMVEKATLRALERSQPTPEIVDWAVRTHEQTGNDDYLKRFLEFSDTGIEPRSLEEMISRLHDEDAKRRYRERLRDEQEQ